MLCEPRLNTEDVCIPISFQHLAACKQLHAAITRALLSKFKKVQPSQAYNQKLLVFVLTRYFDSSFRRLKYDKRSFPDPKKIHMKFLQPGINTELINICIKCVTVSKITAFLPKQGDYNSREEILKDTTSEKQDYRLWINDDLNS